MLPIGGRPCLDHGLDQLLRGVHPRPPAVHYHSMAEIVRFAGGQRIGRTTIIGGAYKYRKTISRGIARVSAIFDGRFASTLFDVRSKIVGHKKGSL